jgi:hypothetical protein
VSEGVVASKLSFTHPYKQHFNLLKTITGACIFSTIYQSTMDVEWIDNSEETTKLASKKLDE